ncbi:hypothetical protein KGA66_17765 [Actinocrinis puniceicyclus]|uniref:Uncharacterized protein n=1 Tax=Actinocrinis puniceicyclus TaxID=977794 RepID=A0A8J7WP71_9ACTN|nr:hypothetical protein [Actinocrinis puniceicyclus]MBS2964908.1 hypothetical protein [Actinocrinis puniceicyclus]
MINLARLQYALLAEFARVDAGGLLTVVGAGFDRVVVPTLPSQQSVGLALRLLVPEGQAESVATLLFRPPEGPHLRVESLLPTPPDAKPHLGLIGVPLAINLTVPLIAAGVYRWSIAIDGEEEHAITFEVEEQESPQQGRS